jgi:hypothetical protein
MPRSLPDEFFSSAEFRKFFQNISADPELYPAIRNGSVTIYYRGAALIRDLRVQDGQVVGKVHCRYIPANPPDKSSVVPLQLGAGGLSISQSAASIAIGFGTPSVLSEYKRTMRSVSRNLESSIVHEIVRRHQNVILDREIKFQSPGQTVSDTIDVCHFDTHLNCLAMVDVKGIHDIRLEAADNQIPEVVERLQRSCFWIEQHRAAIQEDYQQVVRLKRRIGLTERLSGVPANGPAALLKKPVLVIGNCKRKEMQAILGRQKKWVPLLDSIKNHAAGLILCGNAGCRLNLDPRQQVIVFDSTVF